MGWHGTRELLASVEEAGAPVHPRAIRGGG